MPRAYSGDACLACGRERVAAGGLSRRGLCSSCSTERALDAATQLREHRGPYFERWRRAVGASVGATAPSSSSSGLTDPGRPA